MYGKNGISNGKTPFRSKRKMLSMVLLLSMLMSLISPAVPSTTAPIVEAAVSGSTEIDGLVERNYYINETDANIVFHIGSGNTVGTWTARAVFDMGDGTTSTFEQSITSIGETVMPVVMTNFQVGEYPVTLSVWDGTTELWSGQDTLIRKTAPPAGTRVTQVDKNSNNMLVDGQPFFPIGVFGPAEDQLQTVADAGFNLTMRWKKNTTWDRYDRTLPSDDPYNQSVVQDYLDAADAAGLYALEAPVKLADKNLYVDFRDEVWDAKWPVINSEVVPGVVNNAKNHPAVIGYYSYDEPDNFYPAQPAKAEVYQKDGVEDFYNIVRQNDPYHMVMALFSVGISKVDDWKAWDVAARDFYPSVGEHLSKVYDTAKDSSDIAKEMGTPYIHTPLFEKSSGRGKPMSGDEQRAQTYLSLIGGAKGLFWWEWPAAYDGNWQAIKQLITELNTSVTTTSTFKDVIMERAPEQTVSYDVAGTENSVKALVKNHGGDTYLIVANAEDAPVTVSYTLPSSYGSATRVFEGGTIDLSVGETIETYGRRVYKLSGEWAPGDILSMNISVGTSDFPTDPTMPTLNRNLIDNGGFEEDYGSLPGWPYAWSVGESILESGVVGSTDPERRWMKDSSMKIQGDVSLRLKKTTPGRTDTVGAYYYGEAPGYTQSFDINNSGTHTYSLYMKADEPDTKVYVMAGWGANTNFYVGTTWQRYSFEFDASAGGSFARAYLMDEGTLWIDAVQVEEGSITGGTAPTTYEDSNEPVDETAPSAPSNLTATAASLSQIDLSWDASTDNSGGTGVKGYKVYRGTEEIADITATSYSDKGLSPVTSYDYTVKAYDLADNVSADSNIATATTAADTESPAAPSSLKAISESSSQIDLSWSKSIDNVGVTGYKIFRDGVEVATVTTTGQTSYSDTNGTTGLTAGTTYNYKVQGYDAAGNVSGDSLNAIATTFDSSTLKQKIDGLVELNFYVNESDANMIFHIGSDVDISQLTARAVFDMPDGTTSTFDQTITSTGEIVMPVSLTSFTTGEYPVTLSVLDGTTEIWKRPQDQLVRLDPPAAGTRITQINLNTQTMTVDGQDFFPIGTFGTDHDNLQTIADAGFNFTMRWKPNTTDQWWDENTIKRYDRSLPYNDAWNVNVVHDYLDAANTAGLYVFENPPKLAEDELYIKFEDPNWHDKWPIINSEVIPGVVANAKNHPAVIGYYNYDEPDNFHPGTSEELLMQEGVEDAYRVMKEDDPYHAVMTLFSVGIEKNKDWEAMDIFARDKYPSETDHFSKIYESSRQNLEISQEKGYPFVFAPLMEDSDGRDKVMNADEQRASTYLSLIGGAKGIFWWEWPANYHENWQEVKNLIAEFNTNVTSATKFKDVILERIPDHTVGYADSTTVDSAKALVKNHNGETYIIVANAEKGPVDVSFTLPAEYTDTTATRLFEGGTLDLNTGEQIETFGRRVYKLSGEWPEGETLTLNITKQSEDYPSDPALPTLTRNILKNGSFEYDYGSAPGVPQVWSIMGVLDPGEVGNPLGGRWMMDDTVSYHGDRSLKMTKVEPGVPEDSWYIWYDGHAPGTAQSVGGQDNSLTLDTDHTLSLYMKANGNKKAWVMIGWSRIVEVDVTSEWQRYTFDYKSCWNCDYDGTFFRVYLIEDGTLWADGIQFEEGTSATAYEDPNTSSDTTPPTNPSNLTAVAAPNGGQIDLDWTGSTDDIAVAGYKIYRDGSPVGETTTITSYSDSGLSTSTTYQYTVKAYDAAGNLSGDSNAVSETTTSDTQAPNKAELTATAALSNSQIDLSWTAPYDNVGVTEYKLYRGYDVIATLSGTATSFSDTGLFAEEKYGYTLKAKDAAGNWSVYSNLAEAKTGDKTDVVAPDKPTLSATVASDTQIDLSWTASQDSGVGLGGYKLYRGVNGGTLYPIGWFDTNTTSYSDTGLQANTDYLYVVHAYDLEGNWTIYDPDDPINVAGATTTGGSTDNEAPTAPANLAANTVSSSQIDLSWDVSTDNVGVEGYKVYRDSAEIADVATTSYSDTGLSASTTYSYVVKAYDAAGNLSADSNTASATTSSGGSGGGLTLFSDDFEDGDVTDWTVVHGGTDWAVTTDSISSSQVYSQTDTTSTSGHSLVVAGDSTWTDYTMSAKVRKTAYHNVGIVGRVSSDHSAFYKLRSSSNTGEWKLERIVNGTSETILAFGAFSWDNNTWYTFELSFSGDTITASIDGVEVANYTDTSVDALSAGKIGLRTHYSAANFDDVLVEALDTTAPSAPSDLTAAAVSDSQIDLSWTASTDDVGVAGYKVYRDGAEVADITATSYSDIGLTGSTTYSYTVKAYDAAGNLSADSNTASATTNATILFSDDFENGAVNWTEKAGTWQIETINGNNVYAQPTHDAHMGQSVTVAGDTTWTNYSVYAEVEKIYYHHAGILGRYQSLNDYYELFIATNENSATTDGTWYLQLNNNGTRSTLASGDFIGNPDLYTLELIFNSGQITAKIDGTEVTTVTDTTIGSGEIGLRTNPSKAYYDNVVVTEVQ